MYKIIKTNGDVVTVTEKLNFIKQGSNGIYYSSDEKDAQGIATNNKVYNLLGREAMANCETVVVVEIDGGACIIEGENQQTETDGIIVDHEYRLIMVELGVTENVI